MPIFQSVLVLLATSVALSALARRIHVPYPALLAMAGAALAFAPFGTPFQLDPNLALTLFVAPVLLDAAYDAPLRDLKSNWWPLACLVFVAVGLTIVSVAAVARALVPDLSWAAAITLGAIVAPPDAAAATAVLRQMPLPHRLVVVLEGESLLNDASALIVYRLAVSAAVAGGSIASQSLAPVFLLSIVGSVVVGPCLAFAMGHLWRRVTDIPSAIVVQFIATFAVWLIAEHLSLSPVLTVVTFASTAAHISTSRTSARARSSSYAVWETAVMVLNALAFVLVGLQLRPILANAPPGELRHWLAFAGAILATMVGIRFVWVMGSSRWTAPRDAREGVTKSAPLSTWKSGLVISWSGMRGIVTLATALALPKEFPHRDLILFTALAVTLGTLVLQGLTLRRLLLLLHLPGDGLVDAEIRHARAELAIAAIAALSSEHSPEADVIRHDLELQRDAARRAVDGDGRASSPKRELAQRLVVSRRQRLAELRHSRAIGDEAFHRLEEELDVADLAAN